MANYSKLLSLINGVDRTIDFSLTSNILELGGGGLQMDGSTSGHIVISASATTSTYSIVWPAAQAAGTGYTLSNDGTGVLTWVPASTGSVTSVSVNTANGLAGTSSGGSTPALTLSTTITGILQGNGTAISAATTTGTGNVVLSGSPTLTGTITAAAANFSGAISASNFSGSSSGTNTGDQTITLTGDVTGSGTGSFATTLAATSNGTLTTLSALTTATSLASVGTITTGTWNATAVAIAHGGTGQTSAASAFAALSPMTTAGDIIYENATPAPARLAIGTTGQVLTVAGGLPTWASPSTSGTVTSVSVTSANGFAGTVATATTTPAITISTTLTTPVIAGNGTALIAATTTGTGSTVALSASPTFTGTVTTAALSATSGSFTSAINMNSNQINNVTDPTSAQDAATKAYVDAAIAGLTWKGPVQAYADSNVPLTGSTPLVIDGYTVLDGDLLLLAGQTVAAQDGEYSAAVTGGSYVLTANGLPNAIGDAWLVLNGTVYADSAFVATAAVPAATFVEFAGPTAYVFTAPLVLTGRTVSITQSSTSTDGYLSSTDWNTFNNKQPAGSYITALTGDVTASGPGSAAATLATVNSNVGSFGSSTSIPSFTVNAKGLITAASGNVVVAPAGTLSGTTLNSTVVSSSLTSVGTIATGVWNGTAIGPTFGGTGQTSYATGDTLYASATNTLSKLTIGSTGQVLTVAGGVPTWATPSVSPGSIALTTNHILVGNASNLAADVAMSGDVAIVASGATTIESIQGTAVSGTTGTGNVVFSASPTLTGTITAAAANFSGAISASNFSGSSSGTNTGDQTITLTGDVTGSGTGSFATTIANNAVTTVKINNAAVTAAKLGAVTDGITTDQNGSGSTIEVLNAPALKRTLVAGQSFSANTSYAVRWGITANSETANRVYAADTTTSSFDLFYVIGMASSGSAVSAGQNITVTTMGPFALSSSDTAFAASTDGEAVFLTASGTFSVTAPSSAGSAVTRIGMVQLRSATVTSNIIDVWPQVVGVN